DTQEAPRPRPVRRRRPRHGGRVVRPGRRVEGRQARRPGGRRGPRRPAGDEAAARLDHGGHDQGHAGRPAGQDARAAGPGGRHVGLQNDDVDGPRGRPDDQHRHDDGRPVHGRPVPEGGDGRRDAGDGAVPRVRAVRVRQRRREVHLDVGGQPQHRDHDQHRRAVGGRQGDDLDLLLPLPAVEEAVRDAGGRDGHRPDDEDARDVRHRAEERQGVQDDEHRAHEAVV
ncbi:MAG: hypothetical protein AVDCRST_MAG64-2426, partial [uncultured Phycisphaerae bacterium]